MKETGDDLLITIPCLVLQKDDDNDDGNYNKAQIDNFKDVLLL